MNNTPKHTKSLTVATSLLAACLLILVLAVASQGEAFSAGRASVQTVTLDRAHSAPVGQGGEEGEISPLSTINELANCRYGLAALGGDQVERVDDFGAGWYLDFGWSRDSTVNYAQYVPVVRVHQVKSGNSYLNDYEAEPSIDVTDPNNSSGLRYWLQKYPGRLWIVGNEVDRIGQGETKPDMFAVAYHDVYQYIKKYDPTARVSPSALVEITPGRLQYYDLFWNAYVARYRTVPQADAWNMHLYILPEVDVEGKPNGIANVALGTDKGLAMRESGGNPNLCQDPYDNIYCFAEHDNMTVFAEQVKAMRRWMKDHGQQNKPLLLTEYSILYPDEFDEDSGTWWLTDEFGHRFTSDRVRTFMTNSFNYLENAKDPSLGYPMDDYRLVQQWLWFAINTWGAGYVSNLVDGTDQLTPVGELFASTVNSSNPKPNLKAISAGHVGAVTDLSGTADVELSATFYNTGNAHVKVPVSVAFYADASLTNIIGTATITPDPLLLGCSQTSYRVSLVWHDLAPGYHRYWAKVDEVGSSISESNEDDNVVRGSVLVDPAGRLSLPLIRR